MNAKKHLVFALDVPDRREAIRYVKMLGDWVGCFKVGLELFVREGPSVIQDIRNHSDVDIFLDLKLHDIPATVRGALNSILSHRVRYATIHAESQDLLNVAKDFQNTDLKTLAVTVLTNLRPETLSSMGFREGTNLSDLALLRARMALKAGCAGIVCSGQELDLMRREFGEKMIIVIPGIRPDWSMVKGDDQSRIITPARAIERGADLLVVGRPIRTAKDPASVAKRILEEITEAVAARLSAGSS